MSAHDQGVDPSLGRLRTLLRMQLQAADTRTWAAFHALAACVRDELERRGTDRAELAALAEVAHLQLRLDLLLRSHLETAAARLQGLAAARAYRSNTRRPGAAHPVARP